VLEALHITKTVAVTLIAQSNLLIQICARWGSF
jgi:hypothetical protein